MGMWILPSLNFYVTHDGKLGMGNVLKVFFFGKLFIFMMEKIIIIWFVN
jgi:hypothetical protein